MTKKTPNAQRPTPNIEWTMDGIRISELPNSNYGARRNGRHYDLEELRETTRWLRLAGRLKKLGPIAGFPACLSEVDELIRIFVASIRTAEKNAK